jgi:two-component system alkaline phosphatase synthesis response regulator PhoP
MPGELILIVDDEPSIVELVSLYLGREGYKTKSIGDGAKALAAVSILHPDLMILDLMLPSMDGFEVCRRLRMEKSNLPILMLTARDEDVEKIIGLELGADDYLTKPFNPRELVARVKAILRRTSAASSILQEVIKIGDLLIDTGRREVTCQGEVIELRTQEFEVLLALARNRSLVMSREKLLNVAWGFDFYGQTRTVDVHIAQIRRKLRNSKVKIETVTSIGYKLVA